MSETSPRRKGTALRATFVLAGLVLVLVRVPSLAQPAGADQALYSYVGRTILIGGQPYLDAWDQKPPGVHFLYALLWAAWPHESVIAAADLAAAIAVAALLVVLGRRLTTHRAAGEAAALVFLAFGNPAWTRLGGVRVRGQSEVFIGLFATAALLLALRAMREYGWSPGANPRVRTMPLFAAGIMLGLAVLFKYNAALHGVPVAFVIALALWRERQGARAGRARDVSPQAPSLLAAGTRVLLWVAAGVAVPIAAMVAHFAWHGGLRDLYLATVTYNVQYSGETYASAWAFLRYLLTFPVQHSRVDSLWMLGCGGCALLLWAGRRHPWLWTAPIWVAAACLVIAVNGSRGLPQYFLQAGPALALAAGLAGAWTWARLGRTSRSVLLVLVTVAVWRVSDPPRLAASVRYDWQGFSGSLDRERYLSRFGRVDSGDKYSALAVHRLAEYLRAHSQPDDTVYVFGFSPWAYVGAERQSASRFFWSRPVIVGFAEGRPGYGVAGLLDELQTGRPRLLVLQRRDWDPIDPNSDEFFMGQPLLRGWLRDNYTYTRDLHNFEIWTRADARAGAPRIRHVDGAAGPTHPEAGAP